MFVYESHLGSLYSTDHKLSYESLYCDECGDSDWFVGQYDTWEDYIKDINPDDNYWGLEYLSEVTGLSVEKILELNPKLKE